MVENDVIENEETQQNDVQQIEQFSTGDKKWDDIIDRAADLGTGDDKGQKQQTQQTTTGKTTDSTQQDGAKQQVDPKTGKAPVAGDGQSTTENQTVQPTRTSARKFGNLFQSDTNGNIYDANGALIARQGGQRAIFHRLWPTIEAQSRELGGLRSRIENYESANALAKKEGLTLDEHGAALQMFVQWKRDPVKTMNTLLTLAEQAGKDVSSIRQAQGLSAADLRSTVQEIVGEAIKPFSFLTEQQRVNQEEQQLHDEVTNEYNAFMEDFPDARVHEDSIANVMRDKGLSHRESYFAVRAFAAERGLDWTKPLAPQLAGNGQQRNGPSGVGNNRRPLPSMNGRNRSETTHVAEGVNDQANAEDSWDLIARRAMAKHGIQV